MRHWVFVIVAGALGLSGCATPYQNMGILGGVEAHAISSDTVQIVAKGNAYTDSATIQRYALRKAAEETLARGYAYFAVVSGSDDSQHGATSSAFGGRSWLFGSSWEMVKPGDVLMVKMFHGPQPAPLPPNMYDASELERLALEEASGRDRRDCQIASSGKVECK